MTSLAVIITDYYSDICRERMLKDGNHGEIMDYCGTFLDSQFPVI